MYMYACIICCIIYTIKQLNYVILYYYSLYHIILYVISYWDNDRPNAPGEPAR